MSLPRETLHAAIPLGNRAVGAGGGLSLAAGAAGRRRDLAFLAAVWGILCASAQVLANPAGERHEAVIACGVLLTLDLAAWLMPGRSSSGCSSLRRTKAAKLLLVSLGLGSFRRRLSSEAAGC